MSRCHLGFRPATILGVLLVLTAVLPAAAPPGGAAVAYRPPVDAPVTDAFRLPDGPYGAGNRGLEYATTPGQAVTAMGDGLVVFAGPVAGTAAVTVLHPDGLRSSLTHLPEVLVEEGQRVVVGQLVGRAGERLHLGVRSGGTYLDPAPLFAAASVHLVPLDDERSGPSAPEAPGPTTGGPATGRLGPGTWWWLLGGGPGRVAGTLARRS